jgi:ANTAR domain
MRSASMQTTSAAQPRAAPVDFADAAESTSALVVELAQLRYAVRTLMAQDAVGSAGVVDGEVRSLLQRRDSVLTELSRRGLDFGDAQVEPWPTREQDVSMSVEPSPDLEHSGPVDLTAKVEQLERGLSSRTVIGQAQGILIERHQVTPDEAFGILVQASQTSNRKLREVAADLVLTGQLAVTRRRPDRVPAKR